MDRNINENGTGKYALLNLRRNRIEWGCVGEEDEFFVIKLKDIGAHKALLAYAQVYENLGGDPEWVAEIKEMAARAGKHSPHGPKIAD